MASKFGRSAQFKFIRICCRKLCSRHNNNINKDIKRAFDEVAESLDNRPTVMLNALSIRNCQFDRPFTSNVVEVFPFFRNKKGVAVCPEEISDKDEVFNFQIPLDELHQQALQRLKDFVTKSTVGTEQLPPIFTFYQFLARKDYEEKCLQSLIRGPHNEMPLGFDKEEFRIHYSETDISAILAYHLISPLAVGTSGVGCIISEDSKFKSRYCPCGYGVHEVIYGDTSFGSTELWYGRPDIIAFPHGAGKASISLKPSFHKKKKENSMARPNKKAEKSIMEVKKALQNLGDSSLIGQFIMQAITFSFLQLAHQNKNNVEECEQISLIPSVAICKDDFSVFMYDHKHDVLLSSAPVPLWKEKKNGRDVTTRKLDMNSVITLWMLLNHLSLEPSLTRNWKKLLDGSCGLRKYLIGGKLEKIERSLVVHQSIGKQNNKIVYPKQSRPFDPHTDSFENDDIQNSEVKTYQLENIKI